MRILVLHDPAPGGREGPSLEQTAPARAYVQQAVPSNTAPDQADNLEQARAVSQCLEELGHRADRLGFDGDVRSLKSLLRGNGRPGSATRRGACRWDLVFNLVETPGGGGRRIGLAPLVLESLGIPYTGCSSRSLYLTSNKPVAKSMLLGAGLPTPPWVTTQRRTGGGTGGPLAFAARHSGAPVSLGGGWPGPGRYILKPVWEHASLGLDGLSVVPAREPAELARALGMRNERGIGSFFAERYVEGRELNLSLLAEGSGVRVLPPAEMLFLEPARPRILCYRSKWDRESPEYALSRRSFDFDTRDLPLLDRLRELALRCWELFGLNGYARVDFRVGPEGPQILEVNADPCIAPDSGFIAAADRGGMGYRELVERIVEHPARPREPVEKARRG